AANAKLEITSGNLTQTSGAIISSSTLEIIVTGAVTLNEANTITTLAADVNGSGNAIQFTDANGLSVGTAGSTKGVITVNGAITLTATTGDLTVTNDVSGSDVSASTSTINLNTGADDATVIINDSADVNVTGSGSITITSDNMDIGGTLTSAVATGSVNLKSTEALDAIDLGSTANTSNDTLQLSNTELNFITALVLRIGDTDAGAILVTSPISLAVGKVPTLTLFSDKGVTQEANDTITVTNLRIDVDETVSLTQNNDVAKLSGNIADAAKTFTFTDNDTLAIGTVDTTVGISTNGSNIKISLNGGILSQASSGSDGLITGSGLELIAPDGIDLRQANDIDTLAATVASDTKTIQFTDSDGYTVGTVGVLKGVRANNGTVTLVANDGNIIVDNTTEANDVDAGTSSIVIRSQGDDDTINIVSSANVNADTSVTITADKIDIDGTITTSSSTGIVTLRPEQNTDSDDSIDLGSSTDAVADKVEISMAEINRITADVVRIGSSVTKTIFITQDFTPTDTTLNVTMISDKGIDQTTAGKKIIVNGLKVDVDEETLLTVATNDVNTLTVLVSDISAAFTFTDTDDLAINTVDRSTGAQSDITTNGGKVTLNTGDHLTSAATTGDIVATVTTTPSSVVSGAVDINVGGTGDVTLSGNIVTTGTDRAGGTAGAGGQVDIDTNDGFITVTNITSTGGAGTPGGSAATINITSADASTDETNSITIGTLTALGGDGGTGTATTVTLNSDGAIIDGNGGTQNVVADKLVADAVNGVGSGNSLETTIVTLDVDNTGTGTSGNIEITEFNDIIVNKINQDSTGSVTLTAGGTITVAASQSGVIATTGTVTLAATTSSTISDEVTTTGGKIKITAGTTITTASTAGTITSTGVNSTTAPTAGGEILISSTGAGSITLGGAVTANGGNHTNSGNGANGGIITISNTSGSVAVNAAVSSLGGTGGTSTGGTIQISATSNITQSAAIKGNALKVVSGGNVTLTNTSNDVATLAGDLSSGTGFFKYKDANNLTVGTVGTLGSLGVSVTSRSGINTDAGLIEVTA
ncbi:MAG: hypothetical protein JKY23_04665, partial [Nitrospinaceae bacterium]|nr:hypothetical protein [Nitrospinaceae bacterium]